jgi:hypothetical protein
VHDSINGSSKYSDFAAGYQSANYFGGIIKAIYGIEGEVRIEDTNQEVGGGRRHPLLGGMSNIGELHLKKLKIGGVEQRVEEGQDEEMDLESGEERSMVNVQGGSERI